MSSHSIDVEHKVHAMLSQCHLWINYCISSMTKLFDWIISLSHSILYLSLSLSAALPLLCLSLSIYLSISSPSFSPCVFLCVSLFLSHTPIISLSMCLSLPPYSSLSPLSLFPSICISVPLSLTLTLRIFLFRDADGTFQMTGVAELDNVCEALGLELDEEEMEVIYWAIN